MMENSSEMYGMKHYLVYHLSSLNTEFKQWIYQDIKS